MKKYTALLSARVLQRRKVQQPGCTQKVKEFSFSCGLKNKERQVDGEKM